MKRKLFTAAVLCGVLIAGMGHADQDRDGHNERDREHELKPVTLAVFGDWPYDIRLLQNAPLLLNSINSDPDVSLVLHIGDIHSGSMPCTGAFLNPLPKTSVPDWNERIFNVFQQFKDPVVYTPGDNEWSDCHKTNQGTSGYPLYELAAVRNLFFKHPGYTLGGQKKEVLSQALEYDRKRHPTDHQFVENVMWEESKVVFVTLNVPGSNNDTLPWSGGSATVPGNAPYSTSVPFVPPFLDEISRAKEVTERSAANSRWLDAAFAQAVRKGAKAVVIGIQADMWDTSAALTNYTPFVNQLAELSLAFGRPVLLINGDSHLYGTDRPLADPTTVLGKIHNTKAVANLTRITVQGSTNTPFEWLRLTIDPSTPQVFSWANVVYLDKLP